MKTQKQEGLSPEQLVETIRQLQRHEPADVFVWQQEMPFQKDTQSGLDILFFITKWKKGRFSAIARTQILPVIKAALAAVNRRMAESRSIFSYLEETSDGQSGKAILRYSSVSADAMLFQLKNRFSGVSNADFLPLRSQAPWKANSTRFLWYRVEKEPG